MALDTYTELADTPVLRIRAAMTGPGPGAAFHTLEGKLPTIKGRKFYGTFSMRNGEEEYWACVERIPEDDPGKLALDEGTIRGGLYARRKLADWEQHLRDLPGLFGAMIDAHDYDPSRPTVEFYRSRTEMHLLVPVKSANARPR